MGSSDRLFNRQRTIYEILGGGIVADVILWRKQNLTVGILVVTLAAWVVFEISSYTLLSLTSSVFLLLFTILFLWAKSAAILNRLCLNLHSLFQYYDAIIELHDKASLFLFKWYHLCITNSQPIIEISTTDRAVSLNIPSNNLNRPAPPLPHLHLSEEMVNDAVTLICDCANAVLSASEDIALGRDSKMFIKVGLSLFIISVIGSLTDILTLGYTSLVLVLTVPALYERYERHIESCALVGYGKLLQLYVRFKEEYIAKIHKWILEKKKLS